MCVALSLQPSPDPPADAGALPGRLGREAVQVMIYTALDTFYVTAQQIADSPSRKDGVDEQTESMLRRFGCELIQESGILLRMPQAVMATGQVLFHRFYCKKSFARFSVKRVAASCVWLAAKLEESPSKMKDVINVFHRIDRRRDNTVKENWVKDHLDLKKYEEMKTDLIRTERHLLKEMGFICHVEHPHKFILNYLLQLEAPQELRQEAWNLANDSLRTTLCVQFKSEVVACGVVYAAARRFRVALPENPPWWRVFDAEKSDIEEVCRALGELYRQPKASYCEVRREAKSFVLTSTAWDPPPDVQGALSKSAANGTVPPGQPQTSTIPGGQEPNLKAAGDRSKVAAAKDSRNDCQEVQTLSGNGEIRDDVSAGQTKVTNDKEIGSGDRHRERDSVRLKDNDTDRDKDRERERDREGERDRDRTRERERDRGRDKEREREKAKDRDYRMKDKSRDTGHPSKLRHHPSSRGREFQSSHALIRDKDHRYHPYV